MARLVLALAVLTACVSAASASYIGGATSVTNLMGVLLKDFGHGLPVYSAVGSTDGILGFSDATYALAFSDNPMTIPQDKAAPAKLTIPLTLETVSFVTKKKAGLKLTGQELAKIYLGKLTRWAALSAGKGRITPVCRSDGSGTTELVTTYLSQLYPSWPAAYVGQGTLLGGPFNKLLYGAMGSGGVATAVEANKFRIGYVQSGIVSGKAYEIAISNLAGSYLTAVEADPTQSIPRQLPPYRASWHGVTLINQPGAGTYPIASFAYSFIRQSYKTGKFVKHGPKLKKFMYYTQENAAANLGPTYFFFPIPSSIRVKSQAAIDANVKL